MPATRITTITTAAGESDLLHDGYGHLVGVGGWECDLVTGVFRWSVESCRILGVPEADPPDLQAAFALLAPDARAELEDAFERSATGGEGWDLELPLILVGGRQIWVRSVAAVRYADGAPVLIGAIQDISAQVAQRLALEQANDRLKLATQSAEIGTWEFDLHTHEMIWDVYMYWLYGHTPNLGLATYALWQQHVHPEDWPATDAGLRAAIRGLRAFNSGFRIIWRDGSVHHIRAAARVIRDGRGQAMRMVGVNWDVTEQMQLGAERDAQMQELSRARDQANRANQAKTRFLASMSHELRTPLAGILGYAEMLRMDGGLSVTQASRVAAMLDTGKHLLEMISGVLGMSEIESGHFELQPEEIDLPVITSGCLALVRPRAQAKGLSLKRARAPADLPVLMTDPLRLRQILINLLGNAVKFTDEGFVELLVRNNGQVVRIEVADSGPGIPAEQRGRLFQDFTRLTGESKRKEGAGLGLALSARLAALMGGRLGYEPRPGGGSVFWLELLAHPTTPTATSEPDHAGLPATAGRALRVLVVDDVAMNRDIACAFLTAAGHAATAVSGGAEAVAAVASAPFDVVLMDVSMPDIDGLEATRRIRVLPGAAGQVPIIGLTAQAFTEQRRACLEAGMSSHLAKPYAPDALNQAVRAAAGDA